MDDTVQAGRKRSGEMAIEVVLEKRHFEKEGLPHPDLTVQIQFRNVTFFGY